MHDTKKRFKVEWIALALAWWFFCWLFLNPWSDVRLDNIALENVRHCLFFVAIYLPTPILTVLIATKWESRFVLLALVPMVWVTTLALLFCFLGLLLSVNYLGNSKQLKVLNVGTRRVGFYLIDLQSFKSLPYILIEEETPLCIGLHRRTSLDDIYNQSTIDPTIVDGNSFSYKVKSLRWNKEEDQQRDRSDDQLVTYDFGSVPHMRTLGCPTPVDSKLKKTNQSLPSDHMGSQLQPIIERRTADSVSYPKLRISDLTGH